MIRSFRVLFETNKLEMPPKGRKSLNSSWYTCEACGIILAQKDLQQHNNNFCPPNNAAWEHPFIQGNRFHSFPEYSEVNDGPKLQNAYEKQFFVYLSQSAMQLCHFEIGEQVVLFLNDKFFSVRTVWPTVEKMLTSVILSPLPSVNNSDQYMCEASGRIIVEKLVSKPLPALFIRVTLSPLPSDNVDKLLIFCKHIYTGKIIKKSMQLSVPFYGKSVLLTVKEVLTIEDNIDDSLSDQLKELNIEESSKIKQNEEFVVVVDSTKWNLYQSLENKKRDSQNNETFIKDIGGYKEIIEELLRTVSLALNRNNVSKSFIGSMGILLFGPNGVGKTFVTKAIANETGAYTVNINSGELFSKFYGETERRLRNLFNDAKEKSPSIILIDNIDTLCPKRGETEQERRVVSYLLTLMDSLKNTRVVVLATTSQIDLVDSSFRRPGRLDCEVELPIPSVTDRFDILKVLLGRWSVADSDMMLIARAAHGFVAADLHCLVTKASMQAATNNSSLDATNLHWAFTQVKPSAMREVMVQVPNVKWTDIGGMDDLKLKLKQSIEWPLRHPEAFSRLGINPPRGVLMYGPPGCSKTMIAKALASESKLNFLSIKGSELYSKWVGESEKAVAAVFRKARAVAPSIVFIDELDAVAGERGGTGAGGEGGGGNVHERVLAQLLTEMDGVQPLGNVNVVAATNRPDRIDKALMRPGRLDRMVYVPLPDLETRICILQLQLVKMPVSRDVVIDELALKTEGYSGAEVVAVCHEAAMNALQEDFNVTEVCARHFSSALNMVMPRTPASLLKLYDGYSKA